MYYVEALAEYEANGLPSLFLAGGITGCPDWQQELVVMFKDDPLTLLNPRRAQFPIHDPSESQRQIEWEYRHLRKADAVLFWFPSETLCPITLYELGAWSMTNKPLFVGCHPEYQRRLDVEIQTRLIRADVPLEHGLLALASKVRHWLSYRPVTQ